MGRWARKTDDNHQEIMDAFRAHGFSVADTSRLGQGFPDLVVAKLRMNILVEVKDGKKPSSARKLTKDEQDFVDEWQGRYVVVEGIADIERLNKWLVQG